MGKRFNTSGKLAAVSPEALQRNGAGCALGWHLLVGPSRNVVLLGKSGREVLKTYENFFMGSIRGFYRSPRFRAAVSRLPVISRAFRWQITTFFGHKVHCVTPRARALYCEAEASFLPYSHIKHLVIGAINKRNWYDRRSAATLAPSIPSYLIVYLGILLL